MDCSTIGDDLIRVDALVEHLAVEEFGDEFDDAKNKTGTTDRDNFMDIRSSVLESWRTSRQATENILAEVFETGTS